MNNTLHYLIFILVSFAIASLLVFVIRKIMDGFYKRFSRRLHTEPTNFSFLKNSIGFIIYTCGLVWVVYKIPPLKEMGTALFAGAGILAVIVGFASQKAFSNIISGVFILIFKPFKINDIIEFKDGQTGIVEGITLRHTLIRDFENKRIIIPNSIISDETIINSHFQDEKIRKHVVFSISLDSNIDLAMKVIEEEAIKHPLTIEHRKEHEKTKDNPLILMRVVEISDFAIRIKAYIWTRDFEDAFQLKCDMLKSVKQRFDEVGIETPYPYRTVVYKTDLEEKERARRSHSSDLTHPPL